MALFIHRDKDSSMDIVLLTGLLAIASKNFVELLKHLANVGEDDKYTPLKGLYTLLAPLSLVGIALIAQTQGLTIDLVGELGVTGGDETTRAIFTAILAGFAAPEAYDAQGLLKASGEQRRENAALLGKRAADPVTDADGDPVI